MLEMKQLTKCFRGEDGTENRLFDNFDLTLPDGQFLTVVGSNGSGKTTLLNLLCGTLQPDGGDILIDGKSLLKLPEFRRYASIGRVYQNPAAGTCPQLTMLENMSLADNKGKPFGLSFGVNRKRTDFYRAQLAALGLGLEEKLNVKMGALSGGQRQAVALVMATLTPLKFLILDEHTAALDPKTAQTIMDLTERVVREKKLTAIMVTHNLRHAALFGDRLVMLHEGGIVLDCLGEEKKATTPADLLALFNRLGALYGE